MTFTKSVLIADDNPSIVDALVLRCESLGVEARVSRDGYETLSLIRREPPNLLILDIEMPAINGLTVLDELSSDNKIPPIPVIMLSGVSDRDIIARCERMGAQYVVKGAHVWETIEPIVRNLTGLRPTSGAGTRIEPAVSASSQSKPPKILAIDDDPEILQALALRLGAMGIEVIEAKNAMQGYQMALEEDPDVVITDYCMPDGTGRFLLRRMKEARATRNTPVIILSGIRLEDGRGDKALHRDLIGKFGAAAYLRKPLDFEVLVSNLRTFIDFPRKASAA